MASKRLSELRWDVDGYVGSRFDLKYTCHDIAFNDYGGNLESKVDNKTEGPFEVHDEGRYGMVLVTGEDRESLDNLLGVDPSGE